MRRPHGTHTRDNRPGERHEGPDVPPLRPDRPADGRRSALPHAGPRRRADRCAGRVDQLSGRADRPGALPDQAAAAVLSRRRTCRCGVRRRPGGAPPGGGRPGVRLGGHRRIRRTMCRPGAAGAEAAGRHGFRDRCVLRAGVRHLPARAADHRQTAARRDPAGAGCGRRRGHRGGGDRQGDGRQGDRRSLQPGQAGPRAQCRRRRHRRLHPAGLAPGGGSPDRRPRRRRGLRRGGRQLHRAGPARHRLAWPLPGGGFCRRRHSQDPAQPGAVEGARHPGRVLGRRDAA